MHIKKLEISGFKSFIDPTVVHFDHDVIGIVGPNGCGKSNIVDAIRWCMGEQSAKHLRGRAMEDVIFNGSESRGPASLAEVTIVFDNSDAATAAELPEEYRAFPEIAVTRRLYRDGTSEYLLNRTQVRLRDVTELFLGTGVGTKAYSIIEQGRIGQIVSARPEDRRVFLEEAAGITKYKQRRRQAEHKLDLTRQNLLRITDIVAEIERTRNSLKRQVAKAERYIEYRGELEDLVLHEASHKLLELIVLGGVQSGALSQSSSAAEECRGRLAAADAQLEAVREDARATEELNDQASHRAFEADNEVSSLHAEFERARDRLAHLTERFDAATVEQSQIAERLAAQCHERAELDARLADLTSDEAQREADTAAEVQTLEELRAEEAAAEDELRGLRVEGGDAQKEAATAEARLDGLASRIEDARQRQERLHQEYGDLDCEIATLDARREALEASVAELAEGRRLTAEEKASLETEVAELRTRVKETERNVDAAKNELGRKRNRLHALEDLHRRHEGVGAGARALLSQNDPAVLGLVADRIDAPEHLTAACAALLGERLQHVVVSDIRHGAKLLERLKSEGRGRANLVPAHPRYVAGALTRVPSAPGVIGLLADQLNYAPSDEALVRALVGDALLVDNSDAAHALAANGVAMTLVSLDGTVIRPDGTISGGSGDDVASAMVEQRREMRELHAEVEQLGHRYQEAATAHNAIRAKIEAVSAALERARDGAHEGELAHVSAQKELSRTGDALDRAKARAAALQGELGDVEALLVQASLEQTASRDQLDAARARLDQLQHALARAEVTATEWRERVAKQQSLLTERKVRLAQVREQTDAARSALGRVNSAITELETRSHRLEQETMDAAVSIGETAAHLMLTKESRLEAEALARSAREVLDAAKHRLDEVRATLSSHETELKQLRESLGTEEEEMRRAEMALQRLEIERDHLLANVRERFRGLDLNRVVGDYHMRPAPDAEHRSRISELTQLIDRMGPVNLDAKAEFEDADRRFVELRGQKDDIERAVDELERAIKHMDKESRRRFKETFDAVNELFKTTFTRLFRGGRAELMLTDPEDMLSTGVDIMAQPPGKKVGNIDLMSGGEKALTAVSLIFAIFQHRPSPFCVLDEVDAPLDEANVARYNEAIRAMTDHSQFILITHIRKTMQMVDVLYGVTMGEPGVSRVVSVKVNEAAAARSDARGANALEAPAPRRAELPDAAPQTAEAAEGSETQVA